MELVVLEGVSKKSWHVLLSNCSASCRWSKLLQLYICDGMTGCEYEWIKQAPCPVWRWSSWVWSLTRANGEYYITFVPSLVDGGHTLDLEGVRRWVTCLRISSLWPQGIDSVGFVNTMYVRSISLIFPCWLSSLCGSCVMQMLLPTHQSKPGY